MKTWKVAFFISLAALLLSNGVWAYFAIDLATTLMYTDVSFNDQLRANKDLGALIIQGSSSYSKKDFVHLLRQAKPGAFIVEDDDIVSFEDIRFRFVDDTLVGVND